MLGSKKRAREALTGRLVIINDLSGDGYRGHILSVDETGYVLVGSGADKVQFLPGDGAKPLEMVQSFIPAERVKFVDLGGG